MPNDIGAWRSWYQNQWAEAVWRSNNLLKTIQEQGVPLAIQALMEVASLDASDEKVLAHKVKASQTLLEHGLIPQPTISFQNVESHQESIQRKAITIEPVTREDLLEFRAIQEKADAYFAEREAIVPQEAGATIDVTV